MFNKLVTCFMFCSFLLSASICHAAFQYQVYEGDFDLLPDFSTLTPVASGAANTISPDVATQTEAYALVYTNQLTVSAADQYVFQLTSDDGAKLYVNGVLVVDNDGLHAASTKEGQISLDAGSYTLRVEYFEKSGDAVLSVAYRSSDGVLTPIPADGQLSGVITPPDNNTPTGGTGFNFQVYDGDFNVLPDFSTLTPIQAGTSNAITLDVVAQEDTFAVVYTNQLTIPTAGTYTFQLTSDDGSKLYIDDLTVVNHDGLHGSSTREGQVHLNPGSYALRVEYFEKSADQVLNVFYKTESGAFLPIPADGLLAGTQIEAPTAGLFSYQVYDGDFDALPDFNTLTPIATGQSNAITLGITEQTETFAVVYDAQLTVNNAGNYAFRLLSDDGSRLLINNVVVIDHDGLHGASTKDGEIFLNPGSYQLRVEYFEKLGDEVLNLAYKAEGGVFNPIPSNGVLVNTTVAPSDPTIPSGGGGFNYQVYEGDFDQLPDFSNLSPIATGNSDAITLDVATPTDHFAVVYTSQIDIATAGQYTFKLTSDDGAKLYVNGVPVVDHDGLHAASSKEGGLYLNPGSYQFRVEYFEQLADEVLIVEYKAEGSVFSPMPADGNLVNNTVTPTDPNNGSDSFHYAIFAGDFDQLPDFDAITPIENGTSESINLAVTQQTELFAAVFTHQVSVTEAGEYQFSVTADDGAKLYINDTVVVNHDGLHAASTKTGQVFLNPGSYQLRVEYFEKSGDEVLNVSYKIAGGVDQVIPANGVLTANTLTPTDPNAGSGTFNYQVYDGDFEVLPDFSTLTPESSGTSDVITPAVTNQTETFAVVYTNQLNVETAGNYTFQLTSDDGSKLSINDTVVVNNDGLHAPVSVEGQIFLNPGSYALRVEYFESAGGEVLEAVYKYENSLYSQIPASGNLTTNAITPTEPNNDAGGFSYQVYEGVFNQVPDFTTLSPVASGVTDTVNLEVVAITDNYAVAFTNQIVVNAAGNYTFRLLSDDGSKFSINNNIIINNDGLHLPTYVTGELFLNPGTYDIKVEYFEQTGDQTLDLDYKVAGGIYRPIPANGVLDGTIPSKSTVGEWSDVIDWPHVAVSAANLPDGRLMTWAGSEVNGSPGIIDFTFGTIYDPNSGTFTELNNDSHALFCSGLSTLENGDIFASGGNLDTNQTSYFDMQTLSWKPLPNMFDERWYGTNVTLPNNKVFSTFARSAGNRSELYDTENNHWVRTPHADMQTLLDEQNAKLSLGADMQWYGAMVVQPDGKVFHGGPTPTFHVFDPVGGASETPMGQPTGTHARMWGNAVSFGVGKVLLAGGADRSLHPVVSTSNAFVVDLNGATPSVSSAAKMHYARAFSNSVVLPNGEVLVIGGNRDGIIFNDYTAVYPSEIYNPQTNTWTVVDGITVPRVYHSTATLMKDGRVLAAGGGACGNCTVNHMDGQVYSPPYLFKADGSPASRPSLSNVPAQSSAGASIDVNASYNVTRFTMVRLSAHTHHLNTDQRFIPVSAQQLSAESYQLNLNANPNVLLPGNYWLFAVNNNGTPSIGQTIQIVRDTVTGGPGGGLLDSDGDGVPDASDAFPNDPNESVDSDGDGIGDNSDPTPDGEINLVALPEKPRNSTTIIVEDSTGHDRIWNVNPDNNSVSVTSAAGSLIAEIAVGNKPWSLAKAPNANKVLVTNKADGSITVIDSNTLAVAQTIAIASAAQPHGIVFNSQGSAYFVVLEAMAVVQKRDVNTHAVMAQALLSGMPRHIAITFDDSKLLVSNFITPPANGESTSNVDINNAFAQVFVLSPTDLQLSNTIGLSHDNRQLAEGFGPGLPNYLNAPVVTFDNLQAYVPSKKDNISAGQFRNKPGITFDQTVRANTSQIQLSTESEGTLKLDWDNASMATGAALSGDSRYLVVALETSRELAVYDLTNGFEAVRLNTGRAPQGVAFSSDGQTIYTHNFMDRSISAYQLGNALSIQSPQVDPTFSVAVVGNEKLGAEILMGKRLFYDALDNRLARDNYMSCASCHNDGGQDGRVWDFTSLGEGLRNTIDLRGRAGLGHGFLHWTGNFDEVQDFEGQIRQFSGGSGLMDNADFNAGTRAEPLGDTKAGVSEDLDALSAYVSSLQTLDESPYTQSGALSSEAILGKQVFIDHNCASCHGGVNFTQSAGESSQADVGTLKPGSGQRAYELLNRLDVPTLRDVWSSAPYLHDGSALTLQDAVNAHNNLSMSADEVGQVVTYILQIGNGEVSGAPTD